MLLQSHRLTARSGLTLTTKSRLARRIAQHHGVTIRLAPHREPLRSSDDERSFSSPEDVNRRLVDRESPSDSTLLPWADPYIASLHRRHEGELRLERDLRA